ncbi:MAG: hypothetical protein P1P88_06220 [Bacteroidales bacterium]|nr:hypothetical protein [Bacteroidales bacterium]
MKNILIYFMGGFLLILAGCDPIEKRNELGAVLSVDQIQATVESTTSGGNQLVLKNITPNTGGVWDYKIGKSFKQIDTVAFPLLGTHIFKFTATTSGGIVEKEIEVVINQIDHAIDANWTNLAGTTAEGKSWVYADDNPDGQGYCYMVANYNWEEFWWFPYEGDDGPSPDFGAEMTFDLNGATNYTYTSPESIKSNGATFVLDIQNLTLQFVGANIPDYNEANCNPVQTATGFYSIKKLTENELVLWQFQDNNDYDWIWRFKRKGYTYPID